jgi:hypothetical protein
VAALFAGLLTVISIWSVSSHADTPINISGNVLAGPSCIINSDQSIQVDFGSSVDVSKINGDYYKKAIPVSISCKNMTGNYQLASINGPIVGAGFDAGLLKTTQEYLGLKLMVRGSKYTPGDYIQFDYAKAFPVVEVVLVRSRNGNPTAGAFRSSGNSIVINSL